MSSITDRVKKLGGYNDGKLINAKQVTAAKQPAAVSGNGNTDILNRVKKLGGYNNGSLINAPKAPTAPKIVTPTTQIDAVSSAAPSVVKQKASTGSYANIHALGAGDYGASKPTAASDKRKAAAQSVDANLNRWLSLAQKEKLTADEKKEAKSAYLSLSLAHPTVLLNDKDIPAAEKKYAILYKSLYNKTYDNAVVKTAQAGVAGFLDSLGVDWLADKVMGDDNAVQKQVQEYENKSAAGNMAGQLAGGLSLVGSVGGVTDSALGNIGKFGTLGNTAQNAVRAAAALGATSAYTSTTEQAWNEKEWSEKHTEPYSVWRSIGNVVLDTTTSALGGALGSAAGQLVGGKILNALKGSKLSARAMQTVAALGIGTTFGGVTGGLDELKKAAQAAINGDKYTFDWKSFATNAIVNGVYSALSTFANYSTAGTASSEKADGETARQWFSDDDLSSPDKLKTAYRNLSKQYHPDVGGDVATFQEINNAYQAALRVLGRDIVNRATAQQQAEPETEPETANGPVYGSNERVSDSEAISILNQIVDATGYVPPISTESPLASPQNVPMPGAVQVPTPIVPAAPTASVVAPQVAPVKEPAPVNAPAPAPVQAPAQPVRGNAIKTSDTDSINKITTEMSSNGETAGAHALQTFYNSDIPAADFYSDFIKAYDAGRKGTDINAVQTAVINDPTKQAAYLSGQADAKRTQKAEQPSQEKPAAVKPIRAKKSDWSATDVVFTYPGRDIPIAYSTVSDSDSIGVMADENPDITVTELLQKFPVYDREARRVLQAFIDNGFGNSKAGDIFSYDNRAAGTGKGQTEYPSSQTGYVVSPTEIAPVAKKPLKPTKTGGTIKAEEKPAVKEETTHEKPADEGTANEPNGERNGSGGVLEKLPPQNVSKTGSGRNPVPHAGKDGGELGSADSGHDASGNVGGRGEGNSEGGNAQPPAGEVKRPTTADISKSQSETPRGANFVIGESLDLPSGEKSRFKANVEAIQIVKNCIAEGRYATTDEQIALSKYVGWGGLSAAFDSRKADWTNEYEQLKSLLTKDEYEAARASTLNAHYTSIDVIRAMYDGLRGMGFTGGRLLEPACGSGNFVGAMPSDMTATVKSWTMVELDPITGNIAKYLYPNSNVLIQGFEKAPLPDNMFDVAISNVPFGNFAVVDKSYPKAVTSAIHNYFFAKALDKVRPGGIVLFITSRYTMDSADYSVRKYIADRADLLGAVRLPDTAFKGNAGTEVVTDILVLKKREPGTPYAGEDFIVAPYKRYNGFQTGNYVNAYYDKHPEMLLGSPSEKGTMHRNGELTYKALPGDLGEQIRKALSTITVKMEYPARPTHEDVNIKTAQAASNTKDNGFVAKGGKIYKKHDGELIEQTDMKPEDVKRLTGILGIRDAARKLLELQQQGANSRTISAARAALNSKYDTFAKEFGGLNKQGNARVLKGDPDKFFILALENVAGKDITKSDIFAKDTVAKNITITHTETIGEALAVSQNEKGGVDIPYIASLSGLTPGEATKQLVESGSIFITRNNGYLTSEQYLSGNVRAKLREAKEMASIDREWQRNVDALEKVVPKDLPHTAISISPGVTWIPPEVYSNFAAHMAGVYNYDWKKNVEVKYEPTVGEFHITATSEAKRSVSNREEWGTPDRTFLKLFEYVLNSRNIKVGHKDEDGKYYTDKKATIAANEKADEIRKEFQRWLWEDDTRREAVTRLYNDTFNCLVNPHYDGSNLTVDGLTASKTLRPHQKDAVQRIISSGGNTLIAHTVGAGKTAEMASAAMKLRQLGIVKKPLFVVPKSILAQWGKDFLEFYPGAHILVASDNDLDSKHRKTFENRIATGDYDSVIVSYEQFKSMPLSDQTQTDFYEEQIKELEDAIEQAGKDPSVKQLEATKKRLQAKLAKLGDMKKDLDNIDFEQLGIDGLFVDEAHNYKNLFYASNMNNVAGLGSRDGSQRAFDLYMKVRWLQRLNGGRGVVFATATPVMNSMSEMFIMQKYLQYDMLQQFGLTSFDAWATQFGKVRNVLEVKPSGKGFRQKQSFDKFINVPELLQMFRSCADVLTSVPGLKLPTVHRETVKAQASQFVKDYIDDLDERAEAISKGMVDPKEDNMLKVTSDGRKVSYSQRMVDPSLPYEDGCKIQLCADKVYGRWENTKEKRLTQLVFCDLGTPKGEDKNKTAEQAGDDDSPASEATENLSIYNDIKKMLMLKGVPAEEIAFIHEANTADKKTKLSDDLNSGKVRVLIGSTGKMGVGLNVQKKVIAIHHLDAPWRPGDMTQQDGRGVRQGNENDDIYIYHYVTEGTFDARMMDILQRKSSFINAAMNGSSDIREMEDIGEQALSFAEIKAIASGNPMIREQVEVNNQLQKLFALKSEYAKSVQKAQSRLEDATRGLYTERAELASVEKDLQRRVDVTGDKFTMTLSDKVYTDRDEAGKALIKATKDAAKKEEMGFEKFGSFGGLDLEINSTGDAQLHGDGTYSVNVNLENASGTIQSLETALRSLDSRKTALTNHIGKLTGDIAKLKEIIEKPFDKQDELDKAQARYNEIMAELAPKENEGNDILDDDDDAEDFIAIDYDSQSVGSARTSINKGKLPAIFSLVDKWEPGTVNLDYGGGKYDNATEYLSGHGVKSYVLDKYNRTPVHNAEVASLTENGQSDTVTISNVLNVIKEQSGRDEVLANAADAVKPDGTVYITTYEGDKSGNGKFSQFNKDTKEPESWQENRLTISYLKEVRKYFSDVTSMKSGKLIIAKGPKKAKAISAASDAENLYEGESATDKWSAERVGDKNKAPISVSDIISKARHDLGIPVSKGHIRGGKILGQYAVHAKTIRTKIANDLPTLCHEIGHFLDHKYGLIDNAADDVIKELKDNLSAEMKDAYTKKKWASEGLAEFMRHYLQNRETAAIDYPKFTPFMKDALGDDMKVVDDLADEINAYYSLDADTASSSIVMDGKHNDFRTAGEKIKDEADKLYQAFVDANHGIKLFDEATGSDAYKLAANSAYSDTVAYSLLTGDLTDIHGQRVGDGLFTVMKDINTKSDKEFKDFGEYLIVKHGPERLAEGMRIFADDRKNSSAWMARRQAELEREYPKFKETSEKLYAFQRLFLETWGVNTGLVSQESYEAWGDRWDYYVPFNRDAGAARRMGGVKRGFANQNSTIKRAHGSGLDIIHPVNNIITNMVKMVNAGSRNNVMAYIAQEASKTDGSGYWLEQVPMPVQKKTFDATGLKQNLKNEAGDAGLSASDEKAIFGIIDNLDDILTQYGRGKAVGDVVTVLVGGKPQFWKINDPLMLASVTNLSPNRLPGWLEAYGRMSRFMTGNLTGTNLVWSIFSNAPRDLMTYFTFSQYRNPLKMLGGIGSAYMNKVKGNNADPLFKEYLAMGGGHQSAYTADKDLTRNIRKKMTGDKMKWLNPIEWVEFASDTIELGPRFSYYKIMRNKGFTPEEAFYGSSDITVNFKRAGTASRNLNKIIPFFNAGIQGLDRFGRWLGAEDAPKDKRKKVAAGRFTGWMAASAVLAAIIMAINSGADEDKENYAQLSNYTKNTYWCIPLGDGKYFAIPKPRELAVMSSFFQMCIERNYNGNEHAFDEFYNYFADQSLPNLVSDVAKGDLAGAVGSLGIVGVGAYMMANRDFLGRPIISQSLQRLESKDQYNERTSKMAYWVGQAFNVSPQMVDYFFQNTLGAWWKVPRALFPLGDENIDYTLGVQNTYVKDNEYSTDLTNRLYDAADKASKKSASDPTDMQAAIADKWYGLMTSFYGNYNKLSKDEYNDVPGRATRQTVLSMIAEFEKNMDNGYKNSAQQAVENYCTQAGDTAALPAAMPVTVTDDDGATHSLTSAEYVRYQTEYLGAYWSYVEDALSDAGDTSTENIGNILTAAKTRARADATANALYRQGYESADYDKYTAMDGLGLSGGDYAAFKAGLKDYDADGNGSVKQSEATAAINSMDWLSDNEQRSFLWHEAGGNWKDKNNPYK